MRRFASHSFLFAFLLLTWFAFPGCKGDPCKGLICDNGATCEEGNCICEPGYEGRFCSDETRGKFIGVYNVNDQCGGNPSTTYECWIMRPAADVVQIVFSNFSNIENSGIIPNVYGEVTEGNNFNIPSQVVEDITFSGSGVLNESGSITINYDRTESGTTLSCSADFWEQ